MTLLFMSLLGTLCMFIFIGSRIFTIRIVNKIRKARKEAREEKKKVKKTLLIEIVAYCIATMTSIGLTTLSGKGHLGTAHTVIGVIASIIFLICVVYSVKSMWEMIELAKYRAERQNQQIHNNSR